MTATAYPSYHFVFVVKYRRALLRPGLESEAVNLRFLFPTTDKNPDEK